MSEPTDAELKLEIDELLAKQKRATHQRLIELEQLCQRRHWRQAQAKLADLRRDARDYRW